MKNTCFAVMAMLGWLNLAYAQPSCPIDPNAVCKITTINLGNGNFTHQITQNCPNNEFCVDGGAVPQNSQTVTRQCQKRENADGTSCQLLLIPGAVRQSNTNNITQETQTGVPPCPMPTITSLLSAWQGQINGTHPTLPATRRTGTAAASRQTRGIAQSFMQALGILPGDSCKPIYSDVGKKYLDCLTRVDGGIVAANNAWIASQSPRPSRTAIFDHLAALRNEEPYICAKEQDMTVTQIQGELKPIGNTCT